MTGKNKEAGKPIDTPRIFRVTKGMGQVTRFFLISGLTLFPISFLWYFWGKKKLLRQEISTLQSQNRFLYTGDICLRSVALTFDDGPSQDYTPQILAVLERYKVKATFFCIGQHVAAHPDLVRQEYNAGHVVANHSWSHPNLTLLSGRKLLSELIRTSRAIQQVIGAQPIFFRPPYGAFSSQVLTQATRLGMTTVIWNVRATDWAKPGVEVISERVIKRTDSGAIILLHDGGGDRSETVAALPTIIETLQRRGFEFVTLQQMMNDLRSVSKKVGGPEGLVWWDLLTQLYYKFRRRA